MLVRSLSLLILTAILECTQGTSVSFVRNYDKKMCWNEPTCHLLNSTDLPANRHTLETRNCMCDAACGEYKDCCSDSIFYKEEEQIQESGYHCSNGTTSLPVYMKVTCPASWSNASIFSQCSKSISPLTSNDTSLITPVTSEQTNITYGNQYCALCHADDRFVPWTLKPICGPLLSASTSNEGDGRTNKEFVINFSSKYLRKSGELWEQATYDDNLGQFTTVYDDKVMICRAAPQLPDEVKDRIRFCIPEIIDSCPIESDPDTVRRCKSAFRITYLAKNPNKKYRNVDCAACNGVSSTEVTVCPIIPRGLH